MMPRVLSNCTDMPASVVSLYFFLYPPALILELLVDNFQRFECQHGRDRRRNGANHVSAHSVIEGSPTLFLENDYARSENAAVAG